MDWSPAFGAACNARTSIETVGEGTTKPGKSRGGSDAGGAPRRALLVLAGREHESVEAGEGAVAGNRELTAAGALAVRRERRQDALILWLSGELDRATSALLERELDGALAGHPLRLVVDLTDLEFIDAGGLETLVRAHQRARENGQQLSFRQGPGVIQRLLALTSSAGLRSRSVSHPAPANNQPSDFALALASADVDHTRPPV
jgi:anti-sigma B factor antagonist